MIKELVASLDRTTTYITELVADLADEELILQPPGMPNHALWTLGHVIHSCQEIAREIGVEPWLPDDWQSFFGYGTSPADAARSGRLSRSELVKLFTDASGRLRQALLSIDESRLNEPLPDAGSREFLPTVGDALLQIVAAHSAFHAGQLAAWRRAIGREPVGLFI